MSELKVYVQPLKTNILGQTIVGQSYYLKSEADKVIAEMEEKHKKEVGQLLMKIAGLEKLVETADKLLKPKGGFTIKDVKFGGIKLEGMKNERND